MTYDLRFRVSPFDVGKGDAQGALLKVAARVLRLALGIHAPDIRDVYRMRVMPFYPIGYLRLREELGDAAVVADDVVVTRCAPPLRAPPRLNVGDGRAVVRCRAVDDDVLDVPHCAKALMRSRTWSMETAP